jgi:hypothetical protein
VKVQEVHTEKIVSTGGQNQTWIEPFSRQNFGNHTGIHDPYVSDLKTGDRIKSVCKDRCIEEPVS